jgi:hypothetical protein
MSLDDHGFLSEDIANFQKQIREQYTHGSLILKLPSKNWKFSFKNWKFSPRRAKDFQGCVSLIATKRSFSDTWNFQYYEKMSIMILCKKIQCVINS